jgi:adsorption protein B
MDWQWLIQFGGFLISDELFSALAIVAVWGFFLSGMDDLFIDVRYMLAVLVSRKRGEALRIGEVEALKEKPIAVMVPAWQEASVIRAMLMRNVANLDYLNYHIFVGTYLNDPDTQSEVDAVIDYYKRIHRAMNMNGRENKPVQFIHKVVTPHPGPTNKADNLNIVYRRIKAVEKKLIASGHMDGPFEIYVLHDCEDVIHPKELKLFNYLMTNKPKEERRHEHPMQEKFDFVQVPVFPLEVSLKPSDEEQDSLRESIARLTMNPVSWIEEFPVLFYQSIRLFLIFLKNIWRYAVSSTYMDEFAEHHTKDMIVRRSIRGLVPSAGVGTGFSRTSLELLRQHTDTGGIFNDVHLTEDYEISLHLKNLGAYQHFVVEPVKMLKYKGGRLDRTHEVDEYVATKEYFPDTVRASIRQKARWVMGITYQTMFPGRHDNPFVDFAKGWSGNMVTKYTLFRDRKALVTNYINVLGYVVFLFCITKMLMVEIIDYDWSYARIFPPNSYIWWLVLFDTVVMVERYLQRLNAVNKIYGLKHSFYFVLRTVFLVGLVLGNYINFMATLSATKRYVVYLYNRRFGKLPEPRKSAADTTDSDSDFADLDLEEEDEGENRAQPAWGKTDHSYLSQDQMREYVNRIGDLAVRSRLISRDVLSDALVRQQEDFKVTGQKRKIGDVLQEMGYLDEMGFSMLYAQQLSVPNREIDPFEIDPNVLRLIPEDTAIRFKMVPLALDKDGNLIVAVSDPLHIDDQRLLETQLGRRLKTVITYDEDIDFSRRRAYGLIAQQQASQFPRLGVKLLELKRLSPADLSNALYEQKISHKPLGEVLLQMGLVDIEFLDGYFRETLGMGFAHVDCSRAPTDLVEQFPRAFCRIYRLIPTQREAEVVHIAVANPAARHLVARMEMRLGCRVEMYLAPEKEILDSISDCFNRINDETSRLLLIGNRLLVAGIVTEEALAEALRQQKAKNLRLGEILVTYGYCSEIDFLNTYAKELYLPVLDLSDVNDPELTTLFPKSEALARHIVPVERQGNTAVFALSYDFDIEDIRSIEERFPSMDIRFCLAEKQRIRETISRLYGNLKSTLRQDENGLTSREP